MSSTAATTTYPFSYTTYTNPTPVAFTKPTEFPTIFSFGSAVGCPTNSAAPSASAQASKGPIQPPSGSKAACAISNDAKVNDHAFWDLYACCKSGNLVASGMPMPCTAQCVAEDGQSFKEIGECLSKRVEVVVCKPEANEIGNATDQNSSSSSSSGSPQSTGSSTESSTGSASGTPSGSGAALVSNSTGAASTIHTVQATTSKAGLAIFGLLALGSAVGMLI